MDTNNLRAQDLAHLWHPYTHIDTFEQEPYTIIERAEGLYLYPAEGKPMLDGIASWWCVALGHSHPRLVRAMQEQAEVLQHCILGNMSHAKAVELAARLAQLAPGDLNHVYFACDGSSATEAAMKMAVQYWQNVGERGRNRFVGLEQGYHGDTLGAIGAGMVSWFHEPFKDVVQHAFRAPSPHCACDKDDPRFEAHAALAFDGMTRIVEQHHAEIVAVILEPLIQGSAGIWIYPSSFVRNVRTLCDAYCLPMIADEIAVGFGRTGSMWACEEAGIVPDILCIGKALTGGYLPMSAAIASERIFASFRDIPRTSDAKDQKDQSVAGQRRGKTVFWDGHTFCGNPITSAVALAALDVFEEERLVTTNVAKAALLRMGFEEIGKLPCVAYQKTQGLVGMCAVREEHGGAARARRASLHAMRDGLFIRPLGEVLYLWPPLVAEGEDLERMMALLYEALEKSEE